jgi:hypothetical protein
MPKRTLKKKAPGVFQLHIQLRGASPAIWRRLLVPSSITLAELHPVLNEAMGWSDSHLHQFVLGDRVFGDPETDDTGELEYEDEGKARLEDLLGAGSTIHYEYDFGDGWVHAVKVEKALEPDECVTYPLCIGGARACPPEDCGGLPGYERLLETLSNPKAQEHHDILRWVGGYFDPEGFDVNRTNFALHDLPR